MTSTAAASEEHQNGDSRQKLSPIAFSISKPFRNVRLMEAPKEVVAAVTSGSSKLKFKSSLLSEASSSSSGGDGNYATGDSRNSGVLHLCSEDKAWAVKQVSTSNSVYLIQSATENISTANSAGDTEMVDVSDENHPRNPPSEEVKRHAVTAVAQVGNFLELHPVVVNHNDIEATIRQLVPEYQLTNTEAVMDDGLSLTPKWSSSTSHHCNSLESLAQDIASPDRIIHQVCARLCLFETSTLNNKHNTHMTDDDLHSKSKCYIPSAATRLEVWTKIVEACAIDMIKLDHAINVDRIVDSLEDDTFQYIARTMLKIDGMFDHLSLFESSSSSSASASSPRARTGTITTTGVGEKENEPSPRYLKPKELTILVAILLLQSSSSTSAKSPHTTDSTDWESFVERWTNLVPTAFIQHCTLDTLRTINGVTVTKSSSSFTIPTEHNNDNNDNNPTIKYQYSPSTSLVHGLSFHLPDPTGTGIGTSVTALSSSSSTTKPTTTAGNPGTGTGTNQAGKRKWHEKFGAQRSANSTTSRR